MGKVTSVIREVKSTVVTMEVEVASIYRGKHSVHTGNQADVGRTEKSISMKQRKMTKGSGLVMRKAINSGKTCEMCVFVTF